MIVYSPKNLKVGDVLLYRRNKSRDFIVRAIRFVQGDKAVHVAIVVAEGEEPKVAEIDSDYTVRIVDYSVSADREIPNVARLNPNYLVDKDRVYAEANELLGVEYSKKQIADICLNHLLKNFYRLIGLKYKYRKYFHNPRQKKYICSTLVSHILSSGSSYIYNPFAEPNNFTEEPFDIVYTIDE